MKKIAVLMVFFAFLILPVFADGATEISTPEELLAMAQDPAGSYVLAKDLDMTGISWKPFDFCGSLDGNRHAILNLTISEPGESTQITYDGNQKEYETWFAGMFCTLKDARICGLNLVNVRGTVEWDQPCFVGALTGYSENSLITDCKITGCLELRAHDRMFGIGGVAGYGTGDVTDCEIDMTLICTDTDAATRDEQFLGGVYATGFMGVENCVVRIDGYDSEHGYVHNGGITGMFMQYPIGIGRVANITDNDIQGKITFFEDNGDRRAYCSAIVGEQLQIYNYTIRNNRENFVRDERREYDRELRPEMCEMPEYTEQVFAGCCTNFGFTHYTCMKCGYSYNDRFTPYVHDVADWVIAEPPTRTEEGLSVGKCVQCGAKLQRTEATLPPETEPEETEPAETVTETSEKQWLNRRIVFSAGILAALSIVLLYMRKR